MTDEKENAMVRKLNRLMLIAVLSISAAAAARAATNEEVASLETGNPHSVDYARRNAGSRPVTKSSNLDDLEIGNPHSVNFKNRPISSHNPTNEEIDSLETGNPDAVK
jgi:hypothetical protein